MEHFKRTQRKWAMWGAIVPVLFVGVIMAIMGTMKHSEAYRLAVTELQANSEVTQILGAPITTGMPTGSIEVNDADGKASLSFSAEGPHGKGRVYVRAVKAMGQWHVEQAEFEDAASKRRIDLHDGSVADPQLDGAAF